MKSQILAEDVEVKFLQKTFKSPLFKHVSYFEFSKLSRFGPNRPMGPKCPFMTGLSLVYFTWV